MCVNILPVCVYMHHIYAWCQWMPEKMLNPLGLEWCGCEPPCGCCELNRDPLQEQLVLLTPEPYLYALKKFPF